MARQKLNPLHSTMHTKYLMLVHNKHDSLRSLKNYRNSNDLLFPEGNKKYVSDQAIRKQVTPLLKIGILRREPKRGKEKPFAINYVRLLELLMDDKISEREKKLKKYNVYEGVAPNMIASFSGEYAGDNIEELKQIKAQVLKVATPKSIKIKFGNAFDLHFGHWENRALLLNKVYPLTEIFDSWLDFLKKYFSNENFVDSDEIHPDSKIVTQLLEFARAILSPVGFADPYLRCLSDSVIVDED